MATGSRLVGVLFASLLALPAFADNDELFETLRRTEYEISIHEGVHQAPNREHGFRTRFLESGIVVVPRTEVEKPWSWGLSWTGYGRGDVVGPVPEATLVAKGSRIDYLRDGHLEWYENSERGLKQSFLLAAPPADGSGPIRVDLALSGDLNPVISEDGQSIDFVLGSERVLRYTGLIVTDARGHEVPARMEGFVRGIRIVLDDSDAVYPITIDPLATSPVWTVQGGQRTAYLGWSVSTAGDVNGDGYSDVIVGAYGFDNGEVDEGRAYVFLGSPSGLGATAAWTVEGNQAGAQLGKSVSTAGDVNGDGYGDVIVGAPLFDGAQTDAGAAWIYLGSSAGLSAIPAWTVTGDQAGAQFGHAVAVAGDVNRDGYSDVIVGAPLYDAGQTDEGRAYVFHGSASGPATTANWFTESNQAGASLGWAVATAGDVDSNGFPEVLVAAYRFDNGQTDEGAVFLHRGSFSGLESTSSWTGEGNATGAQFGNAVSTAGDVNGDGYADVLVGANRYTNGQTGEGRALVYLGSGAGLGTTPAWSIESNQTNAELGQSVGTAGDVDGDGFADVLVGTPEHDSFDFPDEGRLQLFRGSFSGLSTTPAWQIDGGASGARYGRSAMTAGDVNGDGYGDVVVGAWLRWQGDFGTEYQEGFAYVYPGGPEGLATSTTSRTTQANATARHGESVAFAGDVNGDGYADLLVGSPGYDFPAGTDTGRAAVHLGTSSGTSPNIGWSVDGTVGGSELGRAVAGAGDVNGDGYGDVLVAAPLHPPGGRVQLFLGSAAGLAAAPVWTRDAFGAGDEFGFSVASAGDVNGDGYADVVVGSPGHDVSGLADAGRADVYLGGPLGPGTTPSFTYYGTQAFARLGEAVGTAGDVNGDGYAEIVLGEPQYDASSITDAGRVSVYRGLASGLSHNPWTTLQGTEAGGKFGTAAAAAGDVNGDGYVDVLVGAPFVDGIFGDAGQAFLYLGSPSGLSTPSAWSIPGSGLEAYLGYRLAGAGDVNGDGFADVVVGEYQGKNDQNREGFAYVYHGSGSGLSTVANWRAEGDQEFAAFGLSVAGTGDANGDGYGDVVVGSPRWDGAGVDQGRAHVYYGNRGPGRVLRPTQRASDDSRPVARFGASEAEAAFRVGSRGFTPFGRGKVRMETEVEIVGTPFDGLGTSVTALVDTGVDPSLSTVESGVPAGKFVRWRARLLSDPATTPFAPARGRWFTIPWGASTEAMLRTLSGPAGRASDLRVEKVGAGVTVTYQESCSTTDTLHAVFEGTLGDFTSHVPVTCASPGSSWNFTPQAGDRYFLVVPLNADFEGSYGTDSLGAERPQSAGACKAQNVGACP